MSAAIGHRTALSKELRNVRIDFRKPYLLNSQKKVDWANRLLAHFSWCERERWIYGDHCWYRPR